MPRFSVVIPHANSVGSLKRLLDSLTILNRGIAFEVIVVANPIDKEINLELNGFDYKLYVYKCARGANRARNLGATKACGEYLLFLDDDCEVHDPMLLTKHLHLHQSQLQATFVGGSYLLSTKISDWSKAYDEIQKSWINSQKLPNGFYAQLLGGHFSCKRELFLKEPLDENLVFGATETEFFQRRLSNLSGYFYQLDLRVLHHSDLNLPTFLKKAYAQGQGTRYLELKNGPLQKFLVYSKAIPISRVLKVRKFLYQKSFSFGYTQTQEVQKTDTQSLNILTDFSWRKFFLFLIKELGREKDHLKRENIRLFSPQTKKYIFESKDQGDT